MSRLDVNTLRHTAGSADNITLDNSQNVTIEGNLTVDGTLSGVTLGTPGISSSSSGDVITIDANHHTMFRSVTSNVDTRNVSGISLKSPSGITFRSFGANGSRNWRIRPDDLGGWSDLDFSCAPTDGSSDIPDVAADNVLSLQGDTKDVVVANGNLILGTSGKGINFSAHGNAGGMTSELLDDYEVGTFTPSWNTGSASSAMMSAAAYESHTNGKYIKIGNFVSFTIVIECSSHTSRSGTQVILAGLPFTSENSDAKGGAYFTIAEGVSNNIENANVTIRQQNNASYLQFFKTNGAYFLADTTGASWNDKLEIAGHYWAG